MPWTLHSFDHSILFWWTPFRLIGQFTPVLALYDPFGVDVPLNFDITHSHFSKDRLIPFARPSWKPFLRLWQTSVGQCWLVLLQHLAFYGDRRLIPHRWVFCRPSVHASFPYHSEEETFLTGKFDREVLPKVAESGKEDEQMEKARLLASMKGQRPRSASRGQATPPAQRRFCLQRPHQNSNAL